MSLNLAHVLFVVITTIVGSGAGRFVRRRSRALTYLKDSVRAILFMVGGIAVVWYLAASAANGVTKAGLAGLYIGLIYGLVAVDPKPRRPRPVPNPSEPPSGRP